MRLLLATNNDHKRRELEGIFEGHRLLLPKDLELDFHHEETGLTFHENALGKARALYNLVIAQSDTPSGERDHQLRGPSIPESTVGVIADDSGLSVGALDGRPGIYSARYGSTPERPELTDDERNRLLLTEMEGMRDRRAHYTCCMALLLERERYYLLQETWHGEIAHQPSAGIHGFGYDPIFYLPEAGRTVAELSPDDKNSVSHRGKAARDLATLLRALEAEGRLDAALLSP
ncbi:MAG: non-canonical purine NTP pyrophosphatase [Spirochaetaceae bacterium]